MTSLLEASDFWRMECNEGPVLDVINLYYKKQFDNIPQNTLLCKISKYDTRERMLGSLQLF